MLTVSRLCSLSDWWGLNISLRLRGDAILAEPDMERALRLLVVTTTPAGNMVAKRTDPPSDDVRAVPLIRYPYSRHWHSLNHLAAQRRSVLLRGWRGQNGGCTSAIFVDRLVGVSAARVRHTHGGAARTAGSFCASYNDSQKGAGRCIER